MSRIVNLIFEGVEFSHAEDGTTGEVINVGRWVELDDNLRALQLRLMSIRGASDSAEICPCCSQNIPKPPPDLTWRRSKP